MNYKDTIIGISLNYIKKERYTGSGRETRYMLEKKAGEKHEDGTADPDLIRICLWPEPNCFEKTPEEVKEYQEFPFTEDGLNDALEVIYQRIV